MHASWINPGANMISVRHLFFSLVELLFIFNLFHPQFVSCESIWFVQSRLGNGELKLNSAGG
jgi:hypothetical protein